jgi:hypothetical protein
MIWRINYLRGVQSRAVRLKEPKRQITGNIPGWTIDFSV